jgi:hypothetical protein
LITVPLHHPDGGTRQGFLEAMAALLKPRARRAVQTMPGAVAEPAVLIPSC